MEASVNELLGCDVRDDVFISLVYELIIRTQDFVTSLVVGVSYAVVDSFSSLSYDSVDFLWISVVNCVGGPIRFGDLFSSVQ